MRYLAMPSYAPYPNLTVQLRIELRGLRLSHRYRKMPAKFAFRMGNYLNSLDSRNYNWVITLARIFWAKSENLMAGV